VFQKNRFKSFKRIGSRVSKDLFKRSKGLVQEFQRNRFKSAKGIDPRGTKE
jgi:hypothetical protein